MAKREIGGEVKAIGTAAAATAKTTDLRSPGRGEEAVMSVRGRAEDSPTCQLLMCVNNSKNCALRHV